MGVGGLAPQFQTHFHGLQNHRCTLLLSPSRYQSVTCRGPLPSSLKRRLYYVCNKARRSSVTAMMMIDMHMLLAGICTMKTIHSEEFTFSRRRKKAGFGDWSESESQVATATKNGNGIPEAICHRSLH